MNDELKPCPFCGNPPIVRRIEVYPNGEKSPAFIRCRNCGIIFAEGGTEEKIFSNWQARPLEDALRAENERLREALDKIDVIAIGYDGYNQVDSLKSLIDELREIARAALKGE